MRVKIEQVLGVSALALCALTSAHATTVNLGPATAGVPLSFDGFVAAQGLFADIYTFTLPTNGGSGYSAEAFNIPVLDVGVTLQTLVLASDPGGVPGVPGDTILVSQTVANGQSGGFSEGALAAGNYYLEVEGDVTGSAGGAYNGSITVQSASEVPEPQSSSLMLAGLAAVAFTALRRRPR